MIDADDIELLPSPCPDYCRSDRQNRQYCRLFRGCEFDIRPRCPLTHTQSTVDGWMIPETIELGVLIKHNGLPEFRVRCSGCGAESSGIGKENASRMLQNNVTIDWVRYSYTTNDANQCCVKDCNAYGFEFHHFAPRNTFPDADNWPILPICSRHHRYWHQTMNGYLWNRKTPQLNTVMTQQQPGNRKQTP